jgi:hypothetical protein
MTKLYYGKYNWNSQSYLVKNTIEGVDELENYKQNETDLLNHRGISDIKWVWRKSKDKKFIQITCYLKCYIDYEHT